MKYTLRNKNTKKILVADTAQLAFFKCLCAEKYLYEVDWSITELEGEVIDCTNYYDVNKQ